MTAGVAQHGHFFDDLTQAIHAKDSRVVVGLDTDPKRLPPCFIRPGAATAEAAEAVAWFNGVIIDSIASIAVAVKLQIAFYETLGEDGIRAYRQTIELARAKGLKVIGDIKRGDIGNTAAAYAWAHLGGPLAADAVTVNPYMGADAVYPFIAEARLRGKGLFVLVRTSNPSAQELQDLIVRVGGAEVPLFELVATKVSSWGDDSVGECGYSLVGAVVGAQSAREGGALRSLLPKSFLLVPGYGAQGGTAVDVASLFDSKGGGAVVNASRSIIYAYERAGRATTPESVGESAAEAAERMRVEINRCVR